MSRRTGNSKHYIKYKIQGINRCSFLLYWFWHKSHYENVPFEIPGNWYWTTLGDVFTLQAGKNITAKEISDKQDTIYPFPCYGGNGLRGYVSSYNRTGRYPLIGRQGALCGNINVADGLFYATEHAVVVESYCNIDVDWAVYALIYLNLNQYATSTAQPGLSVATINEVLLPVPPIDEQKRIANEIEKWFDLIKEIESGKVELKSYIKQATSKILDLAISGKLVPQDPNDEPAIELLKRINPGFEPCDNSHYGNLPRGWAVCRLEDILDYEQPQAYIVNSTDYSDEYETPVLTAGKSFIIGYTNETNGICDRLPVIIFDDFTTDSKLVDFPFKVKSSAMKILRTKGEININYIAYYMSITRLIGDTHKRYWISEYSKLLIPIPPYQEQLRIVDTIETIFNEILKITAELS